MRRKRTHDEQEKTGGGDGRCVDLRAKALLPAHVGRFCLARHSWDDPLIRAHAVGRGKPYRLLTPVIGEVVELDNDQQKFSRWWEGLP